MALDVCVSVKISDSCINGMIGQAVHKYVMLIIISRRFWSINLFGRIVNDTRTAALGRFVLSLCGAKNSAEEGK